MATYAVNRDAVAHARRLIDAKHTIFQKRLVRTAHRVNRYTTRHFELLPRE